MRSPVRPTFARRFAVAFVVLLTGDGLAAGGLAARPPRGAPSPTFAVARPAATGRVEAGPAMHAPRAAHTATALADGSVLVAGGMTEGSADEGALATLERFVPSATSGASPGPSTGRFIAAGRLREARQSHTATRLADDRVLFVGGYGAGGRVLASGELYDPRTGRVAPAGSLATARAGHEAVALPDGRVLVIGGVGAGWSFLASAELYDPAAGRFAPTGAMRVARESHTATLLADGTVLVAGGHAGRGAALVLHAASERWDASRRDPTTGAPGAFRAAAPMRLARHKHDAVRLADGQLLVLGGADARDDRGTYRSVERWDPARDRWVPAGDLVVPHYKHAGTSLLLADGGVLVASGAGAVERYDPMRGASALVPLAPGTARPRGSFAAVAPLDAGLPGGATAARGVRAALITGGYGRGRGATAEAWIYRGDDRAR